MYTLLLVDDEPFIRNAMSTIIDWNSLGFDRILQAEDGVEALKLVEEESVDLILTDIAMPFMDGLELAQKIAMEHKDIYVVILSGYEDFEYAQRGISYGVKDYILKPVGADSLYKKMKGICANLNLETSQKNYVSKMKGQLHRVLPELREKLLTTFICNGELSEDGFMIRSESVELTIEKGLYTTCVLEPEWDFIETRDMDLFLFAIKNIIVDTIGDKHLVFNHSTSRVIVVFSFDEETEAVHQMVYEALNVIQKIVFTTLNLEVTCSMGRITSRLSELHTSYNDADKAMECRYILGGKVVYDISDLTYLDTTYVYPETQMKAIIYATKFQGEKEIEESFEELNEYIFLKHKLTIENLKMISIELISKLLKELANVKDVKENLWKEGFDLYRALENCKRFTNVLEDIEKFARNISTELQKLKDSSTKIIIEKVERYIEENYMNEGISLSTTAEKVGVSTGYLCALYKKETGKNFTKYIMDIRVQKAMMLLNTSDKKNYVIAMETGFNNAHYFSTTFKKLVGLTPTEYRENKGQKDGD